MITMLWQICNMKMESELKIEPWRKKQVFHSERSKEAVMSEYIIVCWEFISNQRNILLHVQ
jgi:hypothetical protein